MNISNIEYFDAIKRHPSTPKKGHIIIINMGGPVNYLMIVEENKDRYAYPIHPKDGTLGQGVFLHDETPFKVIKKFDKNQN